ncbi:DedA family protein/thiosulfate sulfurtransferase GlpE [Solimonas variicoloris]|uniref:DedA family protein/thiosulfate sulfurtransferase GlpE n=1 Tax=Solimonas variicoloris TaxID=254408 RepID=UPI0003623B66|nr:VTT domain-containing protein [Solimonas variicoloris]
MLDALSPTILAPLLAALCVSGAALGLPVPTMPALIYAGSVAVGRADAAALLAATFAAAVAGGFAGDAVWYLAGRRYGFRVLRVLCRLSLSRDTCVRRTETFFARRGVRILLVARFLPGLAVVSVPMTGLSRVPFRRFAAHDLAGVSLWVGGGLALGALLAGQVDALLAWLQNAGVGLGGVVLLVLAVFIAQRVWRRQRLLRALRASRISVDELHALMEAEAPPLLIDVRSAPNREQDPWRIPGASTPEPDVLELALADLPRDRTVVLYCACPNEISAAQMAQRMRALGFSDVRPLLGGLDAWRASGRDLLPLDALDDTPDDAPAVPLVVAPPPGSRVEA